MKTIPNSSWVTIEQNDVSKRPTRNGPRFQLIVEFAQGVCLPTSSAFSLHEAIESFLQQKPMCAEGDVLLFDCAERRSIASVKWRMHTTELGLRVTRRQNVFHEWHLALIAMELQQRRVTESATESNF